MTNPHTHKPQPSTLGLALALACGGWLSLGAAGALAQSLPTGAQAIAGSASLSQTGKQLTVTTTNAAGSNFSAINWQTFSVGSGYGTYFAQPSANSTSINRVVTNTPSQIFGTLGSNGKLVLVNQAGIAVGAGAMVDTAGFTASSLALSEADAKAGLLRFVGDASSGDLTVQGRVMARGGDVVLIAPSVTVDKDALIQAPDGAVVLAAGRSALVTGPGLQGVVLQVTAPSDTALNLGQLQGDAVGIFAGTLKHSGTIQANGVTVEGGKVRLISTTSTEVTGAVSATKNAGTLGGDIAISSAGDVLLGSTAQVLANGSLGGGTVSVGGGWQGGRADIVNAQGTRVMEGALVSANATEQGNGGSVAIWSQGSTETHGTLQARGAGAGGNGGQVETSGHQLTRSGLPDVSAGAGGAAGTWLLDPSDVIIQLGSGTSGSFSGTLSSVAYGPSTIYESEIESFAINGNINIAATRSIMAVPDTGSTSDNTLKLSGHSLTLTTTNRSATDPCTTAACGIDLSAFYGGIQTGGGEVVAITGYSPTVPNVQRSSTGVEAASITLPSITTGGASGPGNVFISSAGAISVGDINTVPTSLTAGYSGGNVFVSAAGTADVQSINSSGMDLSALPTGCGPCNSLNAGQISVEGNAISVAGDLNAHSGSSPDLMGSGASITLTATGQGLNGSPAIAFNTNSYGYQAINTYSGGPNASPATGPGFGGGSVNITAQNGDIVFGNLAINTSGGNAVNAIAPATPTNYSGGSAGSVQIQATHPDSASGIYGSQLNIVANGGNGGATGGGGAGGTVDVQSGTDITLAASASVPVGLIDPTEPTLFLSSVRSPSLNIVVNGGSGLSSGSGGQVHVSSSAAMNIDGGLMIQALGSPQTGQVEVQVGAGDLSLLGSTLSASGSVQLRSKTGAVLGDHTASASPQISAPIVTAFAKTGIDLSVDAKVLALGNGIEPNAVASGSSAGNGAIVVNDWGSAGVSLQFAGNRSGDVSITSAGALSVDGTFPGVTPTGIAMGVYGNNVTLQSSGMTINRSIVAQAGDLSLDAGAGNMVIRPRVATGATSATPVELGGTHVTLKGQNILVSGDADVALPTAWVGLPVTTNTTSPTYPSLPSGHFGSEPAGVRIEALSSLVLDAPGGNINVSAASTGTAPSAVQMYAPSVTLTSSGMNLFGGSQANAYAAIEYGSGGLQLNVANGANIHLNPGAGQNADAVITGTIDPNTSGTTNYSACLTCKPDWLLGLSPRMLAAANRGIGSSVDPALTSLVLKINSLSVSQQQALKDYLLAQAQSTDSTALDLLTGKFKLALSALQAEICN